MATDCIAQVTFGFEPKGKPVVARFDMPHASSDGGAVLLKSLDTQLQLTERVAACVIDGRQPGKVHHATLELLVPSTYPIQVLGGPAAAVRLTHWALTAKDTQREPTWSVRISDPEGRRSEHRLANTLTADFSVAGTPSGQARSYAASRVYR